MMNDSRRLWYQKGYHQAVRDMKEPEPVAWIYEKELKEGFTQRTLSFGYEPEFEGKITPLYIIGEDCVKSNEKLHALKKASNLLLEELETYHNQYPHMVKGYVLDGVELLKNVIKELEE